MATSEVDLCNLALDRLGAESITALTDNTERARKCARTYPTTRDRLLDQIRPNFAVARVALARLVAPPVYGYGWFFQLPPGTLRVLDIGDEEDYGWKREGDRLACDANAVNARLILQVADVTKYTPLFTEALVCQLAADLAFPITKYEGFWRSHKGAAEAAILAAQAAEGAEGSMVVFQDSTLRDARR
jgi:hypothetical protein